MRRTSRHKNGRARGSLNDVLPHPNTQLAFEHIPGFIVFAMQMKRRDPARRSRRSAVIFPFGDYKVRAHRSHNTSGERRSYHNVR
jgi:hypothetical protein